MAMTKTVRFASLVSLALWWPSALRGSELLTNGSFELPAIPTIDQLYIAPSTAITGWTLTEGSVNVNHTSAIFGTAHSGEQMVDINGSESGTLQQSFSTIVGESYLLTLYYANNPNPAFASPPYNADVTLFGTGTLYSEFITHSDSVAWDMKWVLLSHSFVADSSTTTLQLQSRSGGFNGVVFDSVSITPVPEPSTLFLACAALIGVSVGRRRFTFR
jgi:hypothetical protein